MISRPKPTLSIIIPVLNEGYSIRATLDAIAQLSERVEVLVVDGGSNDDTCEIASARGAKVIASECGRGVQMQRGAQEALGDVFWFLHADTIVPKESAKVIIAALENAEVVGGNFDVHFSGGGWAARFMTSLYPQLRRLGLCYGDSAIFVGRDAYCKAGGIKALPIFEDLDFLRDLRRTGNFVHLSSTVVTSSRRFEGRSFVITFARWVVLQLLYWLGGNPGSLARFYSPPGDSRKKLKTENIRNISRPSGIYDDGKQ
jgi:rSAM/selenodomain-associated transferase 2